MSVSNYYRSDGWVKNTLGASIPGAQVYVLNQPANVQAPITPPRTTPVPFVPNPQALIYSDQGLTPIAQPILTDGFGHYDFYVLPGVYTVAIYFGGKLQNFYIDQSIGNVGSTGGGSVVFETNGTPNFNQNLLNLTQGVGILLSTDNFGNTTISFTGSATPLTLKTNSVQNPVQTLLNMLQGTGMSISDDGLGNITFSSNFSGVTTINAQGSSYTAVIGDANNIVAMNSGSANTFTVPKNSSVAFPVGTTLTVFQEGAGTTTLTPDTGVTILTPASLLTRTRYSTVSVIKLSTDTWWAAGDLS